MKRCNKCNLEVNSIRKTCPLCLSVLESDGQIYYKKYPTPKIIPHKRSLVLRILAFLSIVAIIACLIINVMTYKKSGTLWSIIVIFNIGYFWLLIKSTFKKEGNVPIRLVIQTIAISLLLAVIDYFTDKSRWSVNYVIPFITMASLLSILSLSIGSKSRYINYFLHIITAVLLAFVPIILWLVKLATVLWPSLAAASLAAATLIGMIVIGDKETKEEIKKRFHI
ncbi:MAG TPA: hypothetical protein GX740_01205 [Acholeplasmataceae bacterium]|nr:hypothetical protein [Acholeplasmataceae bacterium]